MNSKIGRRPQTANKAKAPLLKNDTSLHTIKNDTPGLSGKPLDPTRELVIR